MDQTLSAPIPFELAALSQAHRYQQWMFDRIRPYLGSRILEVGSGIGNMSKYLPAGECLILSESDASLLPLLHQSMRDRMVEVTSPIQIIHLDLASEELKTLESKKIDTVISFNVLEHVENDAGALGRLHELVLKTPIREGQKRRIITLVPAHPFLMGSVDRSYGHYRRYSRKRFEQIMRFIGFQGTLRFEHFNPVGVPGWFVMNRVLKKQNLGSGSVRSFELLCPYVKGFSDFLNLKLKLPIGQSLICIMEF